MVWLAFHVYADPAAPYVPADYPHPWPTAAQLHATRRAVRSLVGKGYLRVERTVTVRIEREDPLYGRSKRKAKPARRHWSVVTLNRRGHPWHPDCVLPWRVTTHFVALPKG